jgi:hypothetical protein
LRINSVVDAVKLSVSSTSRFTQIVTAPISRTSVATTISAQTAILRRGEIELEACSCSAAVCVRALICFSPQRAVQNVTPSGAFCGRGS